MAKLGIYEMTFKADDGTRLTVNADSRDLLAWEREKSGRSAARGLQSMEDFYSVGHLAATRSDSWKGRLSEFENAFVVAEVVEVIDEETGEADEGGPTRPDR